MYIYNGNTNTTPAGPLFTDICLVRCEHHSLDSNVYIYLATKYMCIKRKQKCATMHLCKLFAKPMFDFIHIPRYDLHKYLHAGVENNLRTPHNLFNENWVNI